MTKTGQVSMSDIAKTGRMDASFHLTAQRVAGEVNDLAARLPVEKAVELAVVLSETMQPAHLRQVLEPIRRGEGNRSVDAKEFARLTKENPHLVLALLVEAAGDIRDHLEAQAEEISRREAALDGSLQQVGAPKPSSMRPR